MAILHLASKVDIAKAQSITQAIEDGRLPKPPALEGKLNQCANAKCGKMTLLARFYIPRVGYCCRVCFDDWRTTPVWCNTRADDVHRGRVHTIPQCILDAEAKQNTAHKPQDARRNVALGVKAA